MQQGVAHDVRMNVRVDTAVHGQQLHILVTSIAQDAADADTMLTKKQTSAGEGSSGSTISTALRLQTGPLAKELPAQMQYMRLAKKAQLHGTVNGAPYKQTLGVAKLTPNAWLQPAMCTSCCRRARQLSASTSQLPQQPAACS